jgi:type I restriction enzyme S subunit
VLTTCWPESRLKYALVRTVAGGTPTTSNPEYWDDEAGTPWVAIGDMTGQVTVTDTAKRVSDKGIAAARLTTLPSGTLLFAMYASLGTVAFLGAPSTTNQAILGLMPRKGQSDSRYIWYWLQALKPHLRSYSRSNTQDNLNAEVVGNLPFPDIQFGHQTAIANFLDRETDRIDRLVEKKQRMIELLQEKLIALISHAVTKGLDPTVPMKDSGIPWLGDIPAQWDAVPLRRHLTSIADGPFGSSLTSSHYSPEGARVIRLGNVGQGEFLAEDEAFIPMDHYRELMGHAVRAGDVVVAGLGDERRTLGRACLVPDDLGPAIVKADCFRVRMNGIVDHAFLAEYLSSGPGAVGAWLLARGTTRQRINTQIARDLPIPVPPASEQRTIAEKLFKKRIEVKAVVGKVEEQLAKLAEYRQALIAAAVTGQINVTAEVPEAEDVVV